MRTRAGTLVHRDGKFLFVELEDPTGRRYLLPPGGKVEDGEPPDEAARRETREETGYGVEIVPGTHSVVQYVFHWGGYPFSCETHFFEARWDGSPPGEIIEPLVRAVKWIDLTEAEQALSFHESLREHLLPRYRKLLAK